MRAISTSPAKVILFGEHFVVSGNAAISMAVDLPTIVEVTPSHDWKLTVTSKDLGAHASFATDSGNLIVAEGADAETYLRPVSETARYVLDQHRVQSRGLTITVRSMAPIGMGLGSSAATAVATVSATSAVLGKKFSKQEIFQAAYSLERIVHGHPSGVDQATVTFGGLIKFRRGNVESQITTGSPPSIIIGNTRQRRSTGQLVSKVTELRQSNMRRYEEIATEAQKIADQAIKAIIDGNLIELGNLMNLNQELLEAVGVSSPELRKLITAARHGGALGAKLTGGGGGGCMIALTDGASANVAKSIGDAGGEVLPGIFASKGVETYVQV